jgi:hypothetical protein
MRHVLALLALLLFPVAATAAEQGELWLYYPVNLQVPSNIDKLDAMWRRAKAAGYTHVFIVDSKFSKLGDVPDHYFKHVERVKSIARELDLKLVPGVFPVGYSNDMLWHDPNLAEGLPVHDTPFVVGAGGVATVVRDPSLKLERPAWTDDNVKLEGRLATVTAGGPNSRIVYRLKLQPFRCYHVSVQVKTDGFSPSPEIKALADKWSLNWTGLRVKPTQDWTEHHVVFNSLNHDDVNLYLGVWGEAKGMLQWKDWTIEEVGLVNVLRRPGTPCVVSGEDGKAYQEGTDYEPIRDPRAGNVAWPGDYEVWHDAPALKTKLPEGTKLRVSWYHPVIINDDQVCACIAEPKTGELLADQAKRMKQAWGESAAGWMMSHDEFRTLGWCKACSDSDKTPGQLLADNVRFCRELLRPSTAYVWNDMFDPFHNAVAGPYYLVNGPWTGSWEGLDKDVVIMNWNHGQRERSLKFFAGRGHKQVAATYYDDADLSQTRDWLKTARDEPSMIGYMYTTWQGDYSKVEQFARLCRDATGH